MISEGSCGTEDWSNDAENSLCHHVCIQNICYAKFLFLMYYIGEHRFSFQKRSIHFYNLLVCT